MAHQFVRAFRTTKAVSDAMKAARALDLQAVSMTAQGRWRTLQPNPATGDYDDFEGPFRIKRGIGPAFIREDGVECFMLDDTARVLVVLEATT